MKKIDNIKASMYSRFGLVLHDEDIILVDSLIYISTSKVAKLFRTSHHNFCCEYVKPLLGSGVRRFKLGRNKYYNLSDVLERIKKSSKMDCSILEMCKLLIAKKKVKKEKR